MEAAELELIPNSFLMLIESALYDIAASTVTTQDHIPRGCWWFKRAYWPLLPLLGKWRHTGCLKSFKILR